MVSVTASLKLEPTSPSQSDHYLPSLLGWLHRLLAWQITLTRHTYGAVADDEYRGLLRRNDGEVRPDRRRSCPSSPRRV